MCLREKKQPHRIYFNKDFFTDEEKGTGKKYNNSIVWLYDTVYAYDSLKFSKK